VQHDVFWTTRCTGAVDRRALSDSRRLAVVTDCGAVGAFGRWLDCRVLPGVKGAGWQAPWVDCAGAGAGLFVFISVVSCFRNNWG
jgi:hypothetical protein